MSDRKSLKILVIDDEATQRLLAKEYLEDAGHVVRQSEDGKRGLQMAVKTRPDVILLDLCLPSIDGYSLCRTLKESEETADTPIILITAERGPDVIEKGLKAGADDFVTKPVDWEYLSDRVVNVWRKSCERLEALQSSAPQAAPAAEAPANAASDPSVEELIMSAELLAERSDAAMAAEMTRMAEEHQAALERAVAEARAEAEAHIAELREQMTKEMAAAVAADRARLADEHEKALAEAIEDTIAACQADAEAQFNELENRYADELASLRNDYETLVASANAAVEREAEFSETLEGLAYERDQLIDERDAAVAAAAAQSQKSWLLAQNWAAAQSKQSLVVLARLRTAAENGASPANMREFEQQLRLMHNSIGQFKMFVQSNREPAEANMEPVSVAALLGDIVKHCSAAARARRVDIRCDVDDPQLLVAADHAKLRYAVLNLIVNAIRFTPAGGSIRVAAHADSDGSIAISVEDNGVGIAPAKLAEITNQQGQSNSDGAEGSADAIGLGLPIVHGFVGQMNGQFDIASRLGSGTTVSLRFPQAVPQGAAQDIKHNNERQAG